MESGAGLGLASPNLREDDVGVRCLDELCVQAVERVTVGERAAHHRVDLRLVRI